MFLRSGAVEIVTLAPVLLGVHETAMPEKGAARTPIREAFAAIPPATRHAIVLVIAAQALAQPALTAASQLVVPGLVELESGGAALGADFAFSAISLATVVTAVLYPRALPAVGFRRLSIVFCAVPALGIVGTAAAGSLVLIVAGAAAIGVGTGARPRCSPACWRSTHPPRSGRRSSA